MGNQKGYNLKNRKRPYEALFNKMVSVVTRDGKPFFLTYEDFVAFTDHGTCVYCQAEVTWTRHNVHGKGKFRYNLDRKDNTVGYEKENCVVCCWECNQIKGSLLSHEEMLVAMAAVGRYRASVRASSTSAEKPRPAHTIGDGVVTKPAPVSKGVP